MWEVVFGLVHDGLGGVLMVSWFSLEGWLTEAMMAEGWLQCVYMSYVSGFLQG